MKFIAPAESADHKALISSAVNMGFSELSVRRLLWLINAPASLISFVQIADNLRQGLSLAAAENVLRIDTNGFDLFLPICNYIADSSEELCEKIGTHFSKVAIVHEGKIIHPLRGSGMVRHSMYTSLWNVHESEHHGDMYRLLQTHILIAHIKLMEDITNLEQYEQYIEDSSILGTFNSSTDQACRFLRDISLQINEGHLIELSNEYKFNSSDPEMKALLMFPIEHFYKWIVDLHDTQVSAIQTDCTKNLGLFLKRVYVEQETENRRGGGKREHVRHSPHDGYINLSPTASKQRTFQSDADDSDNDWGNQELVRHHFEPADDDVDPGPSEGDTGEELYLSSYEEDARSMLSRIFSANGQVRQQMMANQLLRGRWAQMTVWEVSQLMRLCGSQFRKLEGRNIEGHEIIIMEAIGLMMTMLWTGSSLKRAKKVSLAESTDSNASEIAYLTDRKEWRIKPYLPTYTTTPNQKQISLSRKQSKYIYLPDLFNVGGYLTRIARTINISRSGPVFNRKINTYKKAIRGIINDLPEGHRVTESKISNYLFHLIASEKSGDVADAILTTARYHYLGQTLLHYTTPSADYIRNLYTLAVDSVLKAIYLEAYDSTPPQSKSPESLNGFYLGSRLCPSKAGIISMAQNLSSQIVAGPIDYNVSSYIRYHNIFTIYTSQMIAYATGIRAVRSPFVHDDDIDHETGLAVLSDKDGSDFYNSRLVWLPESVRTHLSYYSQHREAVISEMALRLHPNSRYEAPYMFILEDDFSASEIRPKNIKPYLMDIFPMPLNVNRRFLRTELKERGCPVEVINCFMGHWSRGEEPWGKYSSLSFGAYVSTLKEHISPILGMLSWNPIQSRLSK